MTYEGRLHKIPDTLEFSWRSGTNMPFVVVKDYASKLDRIPQDRTKPCTIPFALVYYGLRIDVSSLGVGDSNKGRFVINELRIWVNPSEVELHLQGTL